LGDYLGDVRVLLECSFLLLDRSFGNANHVRNRFGQRKPCELLLEVFDLLFQVGTGFNRAGGAFADRFEGAFPGVEFAVRGLVDLLLLERLFDADRVRLVGVG
jgi:hypothetical protein